MVCGVMLCCAVQCVFDWLECLSGLEGGVLKGGLG